MTAAETTGISAETVSDEADAVAMLLRIQAHLMGIEAKLDHVDERVHSLVRVIDEHRPLLARAAALADPGRAVRGMLHPKKGRPGAVPQGD